jgi:hypothetical protein
MKSSVAESKNIKGLGCVVFSESFTHNNAKVHYTDAIEGIDSNLTRCVQLGFFAIYQFLVNRLKIPTIKELDCTSQDVTKSFLSTFEALSYTFEAEDT